MNKRSVYAICSIALLPLTYLGCARHGGHSSASLPDKVSYNFHIRPILSDKCFACHGPDANKREAHLRLDKPESAFAPLTETKGAFALVKGKPDESELYKRISSTDPHYQMPTPESHMGALTPDQIALFKKWIEQGAQYESHWAFTAPVKPEVPKPADAKWCRNEIDNFVLDQLIKRDLSPNEESDKERLLKRVSLDITGLPPSLEMMDAFLADNTPGAYDKMIDKLIADEAYGEKMAIHWLDVARYSDSYGYQDDNIRSQWPWRDWLIHAFNTNMHYDDFLTWQLAGDLLPNPTKEQLLATAFLRNHKYTEEGGVVPEEYRIEYILDKVKTFGKGVMGVTIECAQCHDHKFDPFSQKDYYSLFAFFNTSKEKGFEGDVSTSKPAKSPWLTINDTDIKSVMSYVNKKDTGALTVSVMGELDTPRKTYILDRGVYDKPTVEVKPSAIPAIMPYDTVKLPRNRLGLAEWTTSKKNPLTARVFVNQMWQNFFGRGFVKTSGDFGMQGDLPSHPQLLDYLAVDFMEHDWDIKRLIKMIVTSATYRQSTKAVAEKQSIDPDNVYLWRGPRVRIPAEMVRDVVLASSGLLVREKGGPSVKPYQPKGLWENSTSGRGVLATYKQDHGDSLYRRGIYTFIKLTVPPPSMIIFDASNRDQCEVKRSQTNTPLQALVMMNDPLVWEASRVLAQSILMKDTASASAIEKAFRLVICRKPTKQELTILGSYYNNQLLLFKNKTLDATKALSIGEYPQKGNTDKNIQAALTKTISAIYNLEEAITRT